MFVCVCLCEQMFVHNASETGGGRGLRSGQECGRQCCSDAMTTQEDTYATAHACVCVCAQLLNHHQHCTRSTTSTTHKDLQGKQGRRAKGSVGDS